MQNSCMNHYLRNKIVMSVFIYDSLSLQVKVISTVSITVVLMATYLSFVTRF